MVCPVCTFAVAGGLEVLREFGVDELIIGIWLGALIVSSIAWTISWLNKKNIHFLFRKIIIILAFYAIFIWPLYYWNLISQNAQILGFDRIIIGIVIGTIVFILAMLSDNHLRKINEGKVTIKYQKVLVPLVHLIIASIIAHLLLKIAS